MQIAQYKGISLISRAIEFITRSEYSHSAFLFDDASTAAAERLRTRGVMLLKLPFVHAGAVVEAWHKPNGVRNTHHLSVGHERRTPVDIFSFTRRLTDKEEEALLQSINKVMGEPYDWTNVLKFVTRRPAYDDEKWFCSELVCDRLASSGRPLFTARPWEIPPGRVPWTLELQQTDSLIL